jgi:CelD/BcsL family acetyltransferase involved in cellulose biosynthesis
MIDDARFAARVVMPLEVSPEERQIWDGLCRTEPALGSAFYTFSYVKAVAEARGGVWVAILEHSGRPIAFLPFQFADRWQQWLRAAEPAGGHMTDYFGLIAGPELQLEPVRLLRFARLSALLFTHLDESQLPLGLIGERPEPGLRIEFPSGPEAYWAALRSANKRFVTDTERRERKLIEQVGLLRFEYQAADPALALRHLVEQKRWQYERTGAGDGLALPWERDLLVRLSSCREPLCTGVISVLYAGETWVASHFGLRCNNTLHYWFPVYNPALRDYSPGRLLVRSIIAASGESGMTSIDRGAGDTPAKRDFANARHLYYRGLWVRPSLRSMCFRLTMALRWRFSGVRAVRKCSGLEPAGPTSLGGERGP